jgi:hypothetical protein
MEFSHSAASRATNDNRTEFCIAIGKFLWKALFNAPIKEHNCLYSSQGPCSSGERTLTLIIPSLLIQENEKAYGLPCALFKY